jgi:hypothetical protein
VIWIQIKINDRFNSSLSKPIVDTLRVVPQIISAILQVVDRRRQTAVNSSHILGFSLTRQASRRGRLHETRALAELFQEQRLDIRLEYERKEYYYTNRGVRQDKEKQEKKVKEIVRVVLRKCHNKARGPLKAENDGHAQVKLDLLITWQFDSRKTPQLVRLPFTALFPPLNVVNSNEIKHGIDDYNQTDWHAEKY